MTAYQKRKAFFALQGLSLIELLVAIVMGLVLIGGVVTVFVANKQTYRFQDALARLQENGRYVLNRMERDIRMADTGGCPNLRIAANTVELDNTSCPNSSLSPLSNEAIDGFDNVNSSASDFSYWPVKPNNRTDVIRVMASSDAGCDVYTDTGVAMQVDVRCRDLKDGEIILVTKQNCTLGAVFQMKLNQQQANQDPKKLELVHDSGQAKCPFCPGNCTGKLVDQQTGDDLTFAPAEIRRIEYAWYFVADAQREDGTTVPALFRWDLRTGPQELVEGVENLQVLYGVAAADDADRVAQVYWTATEVKNANAWGNVQSVRLHLLLRSLDPNAIWDDARIEFVPGGEAPPVYGQKGFNSPDLASGYGDATADYHVWSPATDTGSNTQVSDRRLRQTYSTTVTLRNRAP